jgi:dual specificity phosphatase 12
MDWITDQVAIGNIFDAQSLPREIDTVLCLLDCCEDRTDVDALCIPLQDGPGNRPQDVDEALRFLDDAVRAGERVLVHCHAGKSRSAVVVARWLIRTRGLTPTAAIDFIAERCEIYLSPGIEDLLTRR